MASEGQILEMDDDDERDFSKNIVLDYFEQAQQTFKDIQTAIDSNDLEKLGTIGHFLKGSSTTLGLTLVSRSCEMIQYLGSGLDENGGDALVQPEQAIGRIRQIFATLKVDVAEAERRLKAFYKM